MSLFSGEEDEDCAPLLLGPAAVLPLEEVELLDDRLAHLDVLRVELGTAVGVVDRRGVELAEVGVLVAAVHAVDDGHVEVGGPGGNCIKTGLPGKLILGKRKGLLKVLFS